MNSRKRILLALGGAALLAGAIAAATEHRERRWAKYEYEMQNPVDDPPDAWKETEFVFARLRYRRAAGTYFGRWGTDANKSDRLFMAGLRRLTRIETRSVEEIVDIDSDDIFNWPWLYAVSPGGWGLSPSQATRLREYFERGGFLMVDDFHGPYEWDTFMKGLDQVYPRDRIVELDNADPIFHTVYDLSERVQISGLQVVRGMPYERGGIVPHWRAAVDEKQRVQVAICFNMDVGDAWEWSDYPPYPEKLASLAYKLGVNYATYSLTH